VKWPWEKSIRTGKKKKKGEKGKKERTGKLNAKGRGKREVRLVIFARPHG